MSPTPSAPPTLIRQPCSRLFWKPFRWGVDATVGQRHHTRMRIVLPLLAGVIAAMPQIVAETVTAADIAIVAVTFVATAMFVAFVQWFDARQAERARASDMDLVREMIRKNDTLEFFEPGTTANRLDRLKRRVVALSGQALKLTPWRRSRIGTSDEHP